MRLTPVERIDRRLDDVRRGGTVEVVGSQVDHRLAAAAGAAARAAATQASARRAMNRSPLPPITPASSVAVDHAPTSE